MTKKDNIDLLFSLFEWAFDLEFSPNQKNRIRNQINASLNNDDSSDEELLLYMRKISDLLPPEEHVDRNRYKTQVIQILQQLLYTGGFNDLANIMRSIASALEEQHKLKMREVKELVERERNLANLIIGNFSAQRQDLPSPDPFEVQRQILEDSLNAQREIKNSKIWMEYLNDKMRMEREFYSNLFR